MRCRLPARIGREIDLLCPCGEESHLLSNPRLRSTRRLIRPRAIPPDHGIPIPAARSNAYWLGRLFLEVIAIDFGNAERTHCHANFVVNHKVGEASPIHQNDALN